MAKAAFDVLGERAVAVAAVSASLAESERLETILLADEIGIRHVLVSSQEVEDERYRTNAPALLLVQTRVSRYPGRLRTDAASRTSWMAATWT